ncbi:MAG: hypothetical protein IKU54_04500 [Oscillospiraceae bacterium]|nr:hypothetical protein [Oscillospiraceae bacterium]
MKNNTKNLYYVKQLYICAAKCLLTDNFNYYKLLTDNKKLDYLCNFLLYCTGNIVLKDFTGCCENIILNELRFRFSKNAIVFLYEDNDIDSKTEAVYIEDKNLFICGDKWDVLHRRTTLILNNCYYTTDRRKYSSHQYLNMATDLIDKALSIDKENIL